MQDKEYCQRDSYVIKETLHNERYWKQVKESYVETEKEKERERESKRETERVT